jgi:hypothetical protein
MRSSSGDRGAERCPYLQAWFWADPTSWYWENGRYTNKAKEYLRKNLVDPARKEMEKRNKEDLIK